MSSGDYGRLAQLVRAPALQAGGHRFESYSAHHNLCRHSVTGSATDLWDRDESRLNYLAPFIGNIKGVHR